MVCHCDASTATALHFGDNGGNQGQHNTKKHGSSNRKEPKICTVWIREEASRHNSLPLPLPLLVFFSLPLSQSKEKFVGFLQQPSPSHSITRTSQLSEKTRSSSLSGSFQFHPQRWRRQCAPISLSLHSIWNPRSLCQSPFLLSVTASSSFASDHVDIKSGFPLNFRTPISTLWKPSEDWQRKQDAWLSPLLRLWTLKWIKRKLQRQ